MGSEVPLHEQHGKINQEPDFIRTFIESGLLFVSSYGWFITFGMICLVILWSNIEPKFRSWNNRREEDRISAQMHKDPDSVLQQQEAMMLARQKLQAQHEKNAEIHREKLEKENERKRNEKIKAWESMKTGRSNKASPETQGSAPSDVPKSTKKPKIFQNDYNPLMGGGNSSGYRSSRRGGGGG